MDYINLILEQHNLDGNIVVISRQKDFPVTLKDFIQAVLMAKDLHEVTKLLHYSSYNTATVMIARKIKPLFPDKTNNSDWKKYLLISIGYKECSNCLQILPLSYFGIANTDKNGIRSVCKKCAGEYQKYYKKQNRGQFTEYQRTRDANKLQRTPKWANMEAIKQFYKNCPAGMEVDHIIPLQGKTVCGLHVENNLQYLSPLGNRKKKETG